MQRAAILNTDLTDKTDLALNEAMCTALAGDWVIGGGTGGEGAAALEVFVDYVLCCEFHLIFFAKIGRGEAGRVQIAHNFVI